MCLNKNATNLVMYTLIIKRLESQIILKSLGASKTNGLNRVTDKPRLRFIKSHTASVLSENRALELRLLTDNYIYASSRHIKLLGYQKIVCIIKNFNRNSICVLIRYAQLLDY